VAGCDVGSRGISTRGRDGNLLFAPWNPPHPDFSFPAAFSLIFHQMARTKVSIPFRTSTTPSSSTQPPLSLLPNPETPPSSSPPSCFVKEPWLTQTCHVLSTTFNPLSTNLSSAAPIPHSATHLSCDGGCARCHRCALAVVGHC